ncbi:MAG: nicotinate (nicotinamide) nucleotide adenylyltransferase [Candidatus Marinamargulisbacteria bacterium]
MRLTVFGGAFDPLHNGHVDIVNYLLAVSPLDRLVIVPTGEPVHKDATFFESDLRHQMLNAVFNGNDMIDISDVETSKSGPSYSIDTIHHLSDKYQPDNITLVVGFDQLYQFHRWRSYEEILQKCRLLVILRRGIDHERLMSYFPKELVPFKQSIRIHEMYPTAISSSRLRIMIQRHQPINDYVPEAVRLIIQQNQL